MALSPRLIRRRIKSVTNTRKITKAMELVAASKMRRAVSSVLATRPYAEAAWRAVGELAKVTDPSHHPLLAASGKGSGKALVIMFSSDRGLCGGFNAQLFKTVFAFTKEMSSIDYVAAGKKGQDVLRRRGAAVVAAFSELGNNPRLTDVRPIVDLAIRDFTEGKYDAVHVAFTDFRSAISQKPMVRQLLPIVRIGELGTVSEAMQGVEPAKKSGGENLTVTPDRGHEFIFEPSPEAVLDAMLPRLVEAQVYQALLESTASEHSSRMLAMRSATDAAGEMIDDLSLTYNQARQAGITREIAEISAGKAALA